MAPKQELEITFILKRNGTLGVSIFFVALYVSLATVSQFYIKWSPIGRD